MTKPDSPSLGNNETLNRIRLELASLTQQIRELKSSSAAETDAIAYLRAALPGHPYSPPAGNWAASYQTLAFIVGQILDSTESLKVLELGSGVSTLWMARAMRKKGAGSLVSIEHDETYLTRTADLLNAEGLQPLVDLRLAPLQSNAEVPWYDRSAVTTDLSALDLVFIDGPPGRAHSMVREPAFHCVRDLLKDGALVLLDDYDRPDEKKILARWMETLDGSEKLTLEFEVGRTAVLRYSRF